VPRRDNGSARLRQVAVERVSAFVLVVVAGVLGTAQPGMATRTQAGPDVSYLNAAHQVNLTIVQASRVAKTKGLSSCVRRVGTQLEADHGRLSAEELEAASKLGVGLVSAPSLAQNQQLAALNAKAGTSGYDAAWLAFQRQQHHQLLALTKGELAKGTESAVRSVAQSTQSVIQMHLHMVEPACHVVTTTPKVPSGDGGQMAGAQRLRVQVALVLLVVGVLLLAGKPIRMRRHLLGLSALVIGIALVFAGPPGDTGKVPEAGPSAPEREAGIPPIRLALPGIVADAPVVPVATGRDGQLQVPKSPATVGWWAAGAAPGSAGGTVLLVGHVDSARHGRGVFAPLWDVPVGTSVAVTTGDGAMHRYRIVARRIYRQEALPSNLFRGASMPRLALVTCISPYNASEHRYTQNLVLYGVPIVRS
jgi:predicted outer membrane protein